MSIRFNMWNIHDWCLSQGISHSYAIQNTTPEITGINLLSPEDTEEGSAVLSYGTDDSVYSCILTYKQDQLCFYTHSAMVVMDQINRLISKFSDWEQKMNRIILSHGSVSSLLETFNEFFPFPVTIHHGDTLLACSEGFEDTAMNCWNTFGRYTLRELHWMLPPDSREYQYYTSVQPVFFHSPLYGGRQVLFSNLTPPQHHTVRVTAYAYRQDFTPGYTALMEFFLTILSRSLTIQSSSSTRKILQPEPFFHQYLASKDWQKSQEAAVIRQLHWNADSLYTVFRIELKTENDSILMDTLYRTLRDSFPDCVCILHHKAVHLFCNASITPDETVMNKLTEVIPEEICVIGQSNLSAGFSYIPELCKQAKHALDQARIQGVFFLSSANIVSRYMKQRFYEDEQLQSLIHPAVFQLHTTDLEQNSSLLKTLTVYIQSGQNITASSQKLGIHRNTLQSRLDKIREITGLNLSDSKIQEALYLSILLVKPFKRD